MRKELGWLVDGLGKAWASPYTLLGLAYGLLGYSAGRIAFACGTGRVKPQIALGNNAIEFVQNPFTIRGAAVTLGNTISYGPGTGPCDYGAYGDCEVQLGLHEQAHTWQFQLLGPFFIPIYFIVGGLRGPTHNPLERAAQEFARGRGSWWPW